MSTQGEPTAPSVGRAWTTGDDDAATAAFHEGADIIRAYAATLTPDHATSFLGANPFGRS